MILVVNIPAGTKICIKNVPVRRGALMLSPCCFKVLGGEVGRLTELAKLYAPVEEEVKSHNLDQRHAVKPPSVNASINTQHQQIVSNCLPRPQGQHQSQQLSEKKRQPAPSLPAQAAGLAIPEKSNDQDEGDIDSFAYSDAIELLGSPDLEIRSSEALRGAPSTCPRPHRQWSWWVSRRDWKIPHHDSGHR